MGFIIRCVAWCLLFDVGVASVYPSDGLVLHFINGLTQPPTQNYAIPVVNAGTATTTSDGTRGTVDHLSSDFYATMSGSPGYNGPDLTGPFTVMLWVKPLASPALSNIIDWGTPATYQKGHLSVSASGYLYFDFFGAEKIYTDLPAATSGTWIHWCVSKGTGADMSSTRGYVNGAVSSLTHANYMAVNTPGTMAFGTGVGMYMDDIRVYGIELTAALIAAVAAGYTYATVAGDPHFKSFSGGTFDITGKPDHIYAIISSLDFTWNMRMVRRHKRTRPSAGTEAGECGIRVGSHWMWIDPSWNASVDGVPIARGQPKRCLFEIEVGQCIFWRFRKVAVIKSECYRLTFFRAVKGSCGSMRNSVKVTTLNNGALQK
eukprot:NODE_1588_length_1673_cov_135.038710_g1509_i0.p1 GENE.NODE_1588_length_1673_cov_135.038710_g1509_i0~~NODE_1588_length_1673_cov_135.038710_g1509_i0.p1  ORF type:complete len:393 (-),score=48.97 NODE_1588_length_1673_cov_135.038710_g1509_i0:493-1614(-)